MLHSCNISRVGTTEKNKTYYELVHTVLQVADLGVTPDKKAYYISWYFIGLFVAACYQTGYSEDNRLCQIIPKILEL